MEDIYGELDNYNDVNAIQELRSENMELKVKLEEHATAMEKLQNDYDTLEMEFKKLENNYSSLLKTARAEIERKTQRITQLNMEKDMMVLSSLQNGKTIRRHFNKGVQNLDKKNNEKFIKGNKKVKEDDVKLKAVDAKNERCEPASSQPKEMVTKESADKRSNLINKVENSGAKAESFGYGKSNFKQNLTDHKTEHNDTPKAHACSIKDRRKSMPAVSIPVEKFSSDEECEPNYPSKDTRSDLPQNTNKFERRNLNKNLLDRHSNKTSETSSLDDKGSNYYESTSRETNRGRASRQYDSSSFKGNDKYEVSLKYRKHYSPDRQRRQHQYQDDHYRQEHGRYHREDRGRQLKSPPPESFSRYQRRNQDSRSNHDSHIHDHDKYRHRYGDKHAVKHKIFNDYDEPHTKRQKTASFGNPDGHFRENKRYYNDKESMDIQCHPDFSPQEEDILRSSCQSPDYIHTEASFTNPVKEIMATAATPLEDPRVTSKRYVIKKENGKEILTTAVGRHVDIKSVDKAVWNIKPVNTPDALVRRPSLNSAELNKEIYMDINNPVANLSLESGEVRFDSEDEYPEKLNYKENETEIKDRYCDTSKQTTEQITKQTTNSEKKLKTKYKIPKIGEKNKNVNSKMDVPIIDVGENISKYKNVNETFAAEDSCAKRTLARPTQNEHDNLLSTNIRDNRHESHKQKTLSNIAIVADDLELSDENSDNVYSHRQTESEKVKKNHKVQSNIKEDKKKDFTSNVENNTRNTSSHNNESEKAVDTAVIKTVKVDEKTKESDVIKKQKIKKKKSKPKDVISKYPVESADAIHVTDKKYKDKNTKKEKESELKEKKHKFTDLFGDSCSLMTPEDLGIPSYLPISEDAQDAVDLKINEIIDATPPIDNTKIPHEIEAQSESENHKATTSYDNHPEKVLQKSNTEELEDNKNKKKSTRKENKIDSDDLPPNDIYENLNPETNPNEADVVKTVIISTGLQPQLTLSDAVVQKPIEDTEVNEKQSIPDINQIPAITEFQRHNILKALATSTPQKEFTGMQPVEVDTRNNDFICESNVSKLIECRDNVPQVVDKSDTNTSDNHDAPDVRIFVKRRRKVLKRPPMT